MNQLAFKLPTWGGKRRRAGRKPKGNKPGVSHLEREGFPSRHPVHVTLRALPGVGYLRGWRLFQAILGAIRQAQERFGVRIVHFSVQGNHLHLLVEADGAESLSRGMQGLSIRIARAVNRVAGRRGKVFADRYHAHILGTRREVAYALRYVLENFRHHLRPDVAPVGEDPCSSAAWLSVSLSADAPVVAPRTWLLRTAIQC
jgi:putative transposase